MKKIFYILILLLLITQFIPINRENPETVPNNELKANSEVTAILKKSCYDCHSNNTSWPWYSYISPIKFLVEHDVEEGRSEMNFSEWNSYSAKKQKHKLKEIIEEIEEGEMPMPVYLITNSEAKVTEDELNTLKNWVNSETN
jgi:hypothetical protein